MRPAIKQRHGTNDRLKQVQMEEERFKGGRLVKRGGVEVWRKEPRFRGGGRVVVRDDPVKDGIDIAFSEEVLPSDCWRESKRLKARADKESEEDISMDDIVQKVSAFTLITVPLRTRKKTKKMAKKRVSFKTPLVEEIPYLQSPELVHPDSASDCGLSVGSDSGCEYDALLDFSEDEAQGWVPVMVREDHDEEEGWVSLTGSWMMLGGAQESKKMVRM
ncbi:hypothetical protein QBC40DRAFT_176638 [Triangularia verruculosa]|uniref:Uncharacterized protein n=1 Tax=Triangularia verruculosa TaxID=2587418 RepID=A0AAN6XEX0_9PEZI|nr:hypothetical protein QBC40DRAFT_176638 [Triangularia verruculosa]